MTAPDWLTPAELAAEWRVSRGTIYRLIAQGELPVIRLGGKLLRIERQAIDAYLAGRREEHVAKAEAVKAAKARAKPERQRINVSPDVRRNLAHKVRLKLHRPPRNRV